MPEFTGRARAGRGKAGFGASSTDTVFKYVPTPRQNIFHACPAEVVFYGGAAGGGKSLALLAELYVRAREVAGSYNIVFRRTFPELERSLILKSRQMFPRAYCKYNEMTHRWTIRPADGGMDSIVDFGYCRNEKEAEELYKSAEFTTLALDEATLNDWETVRFLMSRSRCSIPGIKPRIIMGSNPGGIGHFWAKEYFGIWTPDEPKYRLPEKVFTPEPSEDDPEPLSRCFIPAKLSDNPALMENDPTYRKKLMLLPEHKRRMLLDGDWETFEGRFFAEFGKQHIVRPIEIPKHWKCYRSIDYGFSDPFVCLWFAAAPDGHVYVYREIYQRGLRDVEQGLTIRDMTNETIEYSTGDPSMWQKRGNGQISVAENYYASGGIMLVPSRNDRVPGWMAVRNLLAKHADGTPILKVFSTCEKLIMELEAAVFGDNEKEPDDINIRSRRDHAIDALRYFAILFRSSVGLPHNIEQDPYAGLDSASRREWEMLDRARKSAQGDAGRATLHDINRENDGDANDIWT